MRDEHDLLLKRLEAQFEKGVLKLALLREGQDDALGLDDFWGPAMRRLIRKRIAAEAKANGPQYHKPHTRPYRPMTAKGHTSFHFRYDRVNKVPAPKRGKMMSMVRPVPQAKTLPYVHGRYIERQDAVAHIGKEPVAPSLPHINEEAVNERNAIWNHADVAAAVFGGPIFQSDAEGARDSGRAAGDGRSFAMQVMSLLHMDGATGGPDRQMHGDAGKDPAVRPSDSQLRRLASDPGVALGQTINPLPRDPLTVEQDRYIDRAAAVAVQPDGSRALITNIDADDQAREVFWRLVEEHERESTPDKMSACFADNADFWASVVRDPACPASLRDSYEAADHNASVKFEIESAQVMRAFLATFPDWIVNPKKPKDISDAEWKERPISQAKFHDGRDGRTQYRLVGELPKELNAQQCVDLLRDACRDFEKRKLPFVAVVHAPDAHNHDANWHFHLIFYDRPCRRVTKADISKLQREGHDVSQVKPGAWDFSLRFPVPGRRHRWNYPLRWNKDRKVVHDDYIETLRGKIAEITNTHLAGAGVTRRVDPGTYADMGLEIEPQEHLGAKNAVSEGKARPTAAGTRNEEKQDRFFQNEISKQRNANRAAVAAQVLALRAIYHGRENRSYLREIASALRAAADWEYQAAQMKRLLNRAQSRADHVLRVNTKLVGTARHDKTLLSAKELAERQALQLSSLDYIEDLEVAFAPEWNFIKEAELKAKDCRLRALQAQGELGQPVTVEVGVVERSKVISSSVIKPHVAKVTVPAAPSPEIAHMPSASLEEAHMPPPATQAAAASREPVEAPAEADLQAIAWIKGIERNRPLILVRDKMLHVSGGDDRVQMQPEIQARLFALYRLQQDEIGLLVKYIADNPDGLVRSHGSASDDPQRYAVKVASLNLTGAFRRYQGAEALMAAIEENEVRRRGATALNRPMPTEGPATTPPSEDQGAEDQGAASLPLTPPLPLEQASEPPSEMISLPEPMPSLDADQAAARRGHTAEDQFDVQEFLQKAKSGKVQLALNNKGVVGENCLLKAGVPHHALVSISGDIRFVMIAAEQADDAMKQITAHVSKHAGHLVHQDRLSLSSEVPEDLRDLWNFHLHNQRFRQKAGDLFSRFGPEGNLAGTAVDSGGDQSPIEPLPGQQKDVMIDPPTAEPGVAPDAASRTAQRAAAIRAAMGRDR